MKTAYVITHPLHGIFMGTNDNAYLHFSEGVSSLENFPMLPAWEGSDYALNYMRLYFAAGFALKCKVVAVNFENSLMIDDLVGTEAEKFAARLIMIRAREAGETFH